ncbi:rhodanese-like domain-containing protein [Streptomyces sp. SID12501]|uniref:rhodanese-like domain-containing protein n=1 Tax=Streptomyces sp. SID12501 TaxID=2706042 RepID=UPI0031B9B399
MTPAEAHELAGAVGTAVLLDVREAEEWAAGHAIGAVHAPLSALTAGASLPGSAQGRPLIAICRSGKRSREAATLLEARGAEVMDVIGGMRAWAEAGLPVAAGGGLPTESGRPRATGNGLQADAGRPASTGDGVHTETSPPAATWGGLRTETSPPGTTGSGLRAASSSDGGPVA